MLKNMKKSRRMIHVVCGLLVTCFVCTGAVYDVAGVDVTIKEIDEIHDVEKTTNIRTRQSSVLKIIEDNRLELGLYDKLNFEKEYVVEEGDEIIVRRGVGIRVEVDGMTVTTSTTSKTVAEALTENGLFLGEQDYTIPASDTEIVPDSLIKIIRVNAQEREREEITPYNTVYKDDNTLAKGKTKIIQDGVEGVTKIREMVVFEDGAEISVSEISRELVTEKKDKIVARGTKADVARSVNDTTNVATKTSEKGFSYKKKMTMTATAYSAFNKSGGYGKTASGRTAGYGIVAVDPKVIPLGTNLYVEGYGYAVAGDTGGVIKGNKIDLCFEKSNKELMAFGRKSVTVYVLD